MTIFFSVRGPVAPVAVTPLTKTEGLAKVDIATPIPVILALNSPKREIGLSSSSR